MGCEIKRDGIRGKLPDLGRRWPQLEGWSSTERLVARERLERVRHHREGVFGRVPLGHDVRFQTVRDPLAPDVGGRVDHHAQREFDRQGDAGHALDRSTRALVRRHGRMLPHDARRTTYVAIWAYNQPRVAALPSGNRAATA
jgi:hypothetical protein